MPAFPGTSGTTLSFAQLEKLWTDNGGPAAWAPTMAAIAIVESGGMTNNLNNNASTGDFSVGLWQINYFGSLGPARAPLYGQPAALAQDPNAQAKAAIAILGGGPGITAWKGDTIGNLAQNGRPLSLSTIAQVLPQATAGGGAGASSTDPATATTTGFNPLDPLGLGGSTVQALGTWSTIASDLTSAAFWKRIGVFTLGGALLIFGSVLFFLGSPTGKRTVGEAEQLGATAALA